MSFEYVRTVERFLRRRPRSGTEATNHGAFVMSEGMSILVIFARKALLAIFTAGNWTLLGAFSLMSKHMSF